MRRSFQSFLLLFCLLSPALPACDSIKNTFTNGKHSQSGHKIDDDDEDDDDDDQDDDDDDDEEEDDKRKHHRGSKDSSHGLVIHNTPKHSSPKQGAEESHGSEHEASEHGHHTHKIIATESVSRDVVSTQSYVCQIHSCRHIEVRALERGYLEEIFIREGQQVQQGDVLFRILPPVYQAKLDTDIAEAKLVQIELANAKRLFDQKVVSAQEVALAEAKVAKALAQVNLSQAELNFTIIRAPFPGIVDRLRNQQGSLVSEGDVLTTLSDNSTMWVYFNVPEARYLEYRAQVAQHDPDMTIELVLANHSKFNQSGKIGAIEADFNSETGNIAFRADFPNPEGLLRHGQTGNVLIHRQLHNAIVIPQRATFEILANRYVYVIDENNVIQQKQINIKTELEDIFVIESGIESGARIVLEGIRDVKVGDKVEFEFRDPNQVLQNLKNKAE
ncbi:efflux RND transporter periplasmic adaptor subunit [Pirellulaceae bacterium SH501]